MQSETCRRLILIGLGGVSNGGKTTTSRKLENRYPNVTILCQDDYFRAEDDPRHVYDVYDDYPNYDVIESMDMKKMMADVFEWEKNKSEEPSGVHLLVIEGILIYEHSELEKKIDLKYFFTLPQEEVRRRRAARTYLPPMPEGYFEKCYWPSYVRTLKYLESSQTVTKLSGLNDHDENFQIVCGDIDTHISS